MVINTSMSWWFILDLWKIIVINHICIFLYKRYLNVAYFIWIQIAVASTYFLVTKFFNVINLMMPISFDDYELLMTMMFFVFIIIFLGIKYSLGIQWLRDIVDLISGYWFHADMTMDLTCVPLGLPPSLLHGTQGPVLLLRRDTVTRILANGSEAFIESCAAIAGILATA